jgi:hypothetical protein
LYLTGSTIDQLKSKYYTEVYDLYENPITRRVIAGLGLGWSKDEYQASNIPYANRGERADQFLKVMKKIWNDDVVEFKGKY